MSTPAPSPPKLTEELKDYCDQFQNIKEDASELTATLTDAQFNWRPSPKKWSISQCLSHLNVADGIDLDKLRDEIEGGHASGLYGKGPFRYSFFSRRFVRFMDAPPGFKVKAPKVYEPLSNESKQNIVPQFMMIHDRLLDLVARANGLDLARIKIQAPVGPIKFSLGQYFALVAAHDRRHLWQAWEVRKHGSFPL